MNNRRPIVVILFLGTLPCACRHGAHYSTNSLAQSDAADLRSRALAYWEARRRQDWSTLYDYQDSETRSKVSLDQFATWSQSNEPLEVESYSLQSVETDGDLGWAHLRYTARPARFPNIEPRENDHWQKWRWVDNEWFPVPARELDAYPSAPSLRDAAAEKKLRKRFEESWALRLNRDWHALYELGDPDDRSRVPELQFVSAEELIEYLDHTVDWVEVIGDRGRVRVGYLHRLADPSLTKLAPTTAYVIEPWIFRGGVWYRDLDRKIQ